MYLTKHHGLGNDFLVAFGDEVPPNAPAVAMELCNRRTGVGADGLVYGIDAGSVPIMRLFNSDGSEAEISGNGLRCFVHALAMRRNITRIETDVDTVSGVRACALEPTAAAGEAFASADMGAVTVGDRPDTDDFLSDVEAHVAVSRWATGAVGNPHVILEVADPPSVELAKVGPLIESHFPQGVNAHFVRCVDEDALELVPWERGAGITLACGSGATVAAQRMRDWGQVGERVRVDMPGGSVTVETMSPTRPTAVLAGTVTYVAAVQVPHD